MGNIFEVAELFFPDLELFFWKSAKCNEIWIFLPFWQNMVLGWLKNNIKCYWALQTGAWRCKTWKIFFLTWFDLFLTCLLKFDVFFAFSKKSGSVTPKKFFLAKIWFLTCKTKYKRQKIHPLCLKNPAEIQEMSFAPGRNLSSSFFWPILDN